MQRFTPNGFRNHLCDDRNLGLLFWESAIGLINKGPHIQPFSQDMHEILGGSWVTKLKR